MTVAQDQTHVKPVALIVTADSIPDELRRLPQWLVWRYGEPRSDGKYSKPPRIARKPYPIVNGTDPASWSPFDVAMQAYEAAGAALDGIGFALCDADGLVAGDLDHAYDPDGELTQWASDIVTALDTYTERSPSGQGIRLFMRGAITGKGHKVGAPGGGAIEFYEAGRYVTITGDHLPGTPTTIEARQAELDQVYARYFPPVVAQATPTTSGNGYDPYDAAMNAGGPRATGNGLSDADVLTLAAGSAKNGAEFTRLYAAGDWSGYSSQSEGDLSLCIRLVYWTDGNRVQVDRLFRTSGLYRDKWDQKHGTQTYGDDTLDEAFRRQPERYRGPGPRPAAAAPPSAASQTRASTGGMDGECAQFHLTDMGNGQRLARRFGDRLRYVKGWEWMAYDGRRWAQDEACAARYAEATVTAMYREAATKTENDARAKHGKWAVASESMVRLRAMMGNAQWKRGIAAAVDDFDQAPMLLNCANGTLDLETGALRPHDARDMLTKGAGVAYDPDATCPQWERFIVEIMDNDPDMVLYLRRVFGYSLTGLTQEKAMFFAYGNGDNGKSTALETFMALLGDYATKTSTETILRKQFDGGIPNDLAILAGARFVVASEVPEGRRLNETLIKDMTGRDTITARFLHKEFFSFRPTFKLAIYGNHKPVISGTDNAIWRRIQLVPFTVSIPKPKQDKALPVKLLTEIPGILNWALLGLDDWKVNGLQPPHKVVQASDDYRAEMDVLQAFVDERLMIGTAYWATFADLYAVYQAWAVASGERVATKAAFGRMLTERGYPPTTGTGNVAIRRGIGIQAAWIP